MSHGFERINRDRVLGDRSKVLGCELMDLKRTTDFPEA